ncbi:MAG: SDR family oxidoreductase [Alphaproteobacteria bacterium]|nr:SDR family oxidoreductase [Alphaproteobacteria bacterium]
MTKRFRDKRVVVTGACGVFGTWIAEAFAREGATLCLTDMRAEPLEALAKRLGPGTIAHAAQLADESAVLGLAQAVAARWGAPDVVVNNAGVYPRGLLLDIPVAEWDRIMNVNVRAPFIVSREMAKLMIAHGVKGAIVNISSGAARRMRNGSAPYCISKSAVDRLTKGLALELAEHGIRVNAVEPGFAPGSDVSPLSETYVRKMTAGIPLQRTSGPADAPEAILYLCSDAASFVTGATLSVDGGNSIGTFEPGPLKQDDMRLPPR